MNVAALVAVFAFGGALVAIFGALYRGAFMSYRRGELDFAGIRLLRRALLGQLLILGVLALTAFLT